MSIELVVVVKFEIFNLKIWYARMVILILFDNLPFKIYSTGDFFLSKFHSLKGLRDKLSGDGGFPNK